MKFIGTSILGVGIWSLTRKKTTEIISGLIRKRQRGYICVSAVHLVMECKNDIKLMAAVNQSTMTVSDGMPLVWILKKRGFPLSERIYGPDLMLSLCKLAIKYKWKIFILGGATNQSASVSEKLRLKFPGLNIVKNIDTPRRRVSPLINRQIIKQINQSKPDLIFVGMGCPYQELWMGENVGKIDRGVMIGAGAAFDFVSGKVKQAPPWIQNLGLEWLFRLFHDPIRLWRRYTTTNVKFLKLIAKEKIT
jgi:N-acetylglucosaminyldiphosphoundecaprenol N-acetyl-beta-D-mannosaminyltransferase